MTEEFIARISEIGLTPESIADGTVKGLLLELDDELIVAIEEGNSREYIGIPETETELQGSYLEAAYQAARNRRKRSKRCIWKNQRRSWKR